MIDAPELVERTLQVPSNIRLKALAKLIMVAFGRKEEPAKYHYQTKDLMCTKGISYSYTLGDILKKKNQTAQFNIYKKNDVNWKHGIVLEKSADYSDRTSKYISLLDGRGAYPSASIPNMETYLLRFMDGKLRKPNFKSVREQIRKFEEDYDLLF